VLMGTYEGSRKVSKSASPLRFRPILTAKISEGRSTGEIDSRAHDGICCH
jgi:hypothetical protein